MISRVQQGGAPGNTQVGISLSPVCLRITLAWYGRISEKFLPDGEFVDMAG